MCLNKSTFASMFKIFKFSNLRRKQELTDNSNAENIGVDRNVKWYNLSCKFINFL